MTVENSIGIHIENAAEVESVSLADFRAYMPQHNYIFTPTREPWPAASVNARIPPIPLFNPDGTAKLDSHDRPVTMSPSLWLDQNQSVEQMTWAPGLPMLIADRLIADGGWLDRNGVTCLNLYRPPTVTCGNADEAQPWLEHIAKIYPNEHDHIINWLAQRVQRPQKKINHALVLGGAQGIGKDTLLEPVKQAIGSWNFHEVNPKQLMGRFNGFLKSVILRVNEARDLGDFSRYELYETLKPFTASPPDVLRVDEKNLREYAIQNVCGVVLTTNHKTDGIYLPADDRRHYVAWSDSLMADFSADYWSRLWTWYHNGGFGHVAAYLGQLDLSGFDEKAPPPKTSAFWAIVDANRAPEDAELADILDQMGRPRATTLDLIRPHAVGEFAQWLANHRNRRAIPYRLEQCGYVPIRNDAANDGYWRIHGKRQAIYAQKTLSIADAMAAAGELRHERERRPSPL